MRIDPIIPIWLMLILCVGMAFLKRRKRSAYIRQIAAIILIFLINLRIMVPSSNVETSVRKLDTYVLFVVDDTISMLAQDYAGDTERLTAVKKDCEHIVDEMDGAKFAVITFNNSANLEYRHIRMIQILQKVFWIQYIRWIRYMPGGRP